VLLAVPFTNDTATILVLFAVALSGINATISLNVALVTDLVHRSRDVGKAISLTILSGNLFGLLAPIITGYVVADLGQYDWAFGIAGTLLLIGVVAMLTMTRHVILAEDDEAPLAHPATAG
jgi:dipeptide/tripeptide permease